MLNRKPSKSSNLGKLSRHRKALFLPMDLRSVAQLMLPTRLALEVFRSGYAEPQSAFGLMQCTVLTRLITQAGFGLLEEEWLEGTEADLLRVITRQQETGGWEFEAELIDRLVQVVNEHDRQLRETRLQVVVEASEAFDRMGRSNRDEKGSKIG